VHPFSVISLPVGAIGRRALCFLNHLQRYLVEEYVEDYQENALTRRQLLRYVAAVVGSLTVADTVLSACAPLPAAAPAATAEVSPAPVTAEPPIAPSATAAAPTTAPSPTPEEIRATATRAVLATTATVAASTPQPIPAGVSVPADDPAIEAGEVRFAGDGLTLIAYRAKPKGDGPFPAILVAHENRGLTDYIKDVTRRLAKAGYVALAVDLLSAQGGTDKVTDPAQIPAALSSTAPDRLAGEYLSGIRYLQGLSFVDPNRLGMVGFCFGGGMTWLVATKAPQLKAAVPYYGPNPPLEDVPAIQAAVLALYGGEDQRIDAGIPAIEEAMTKNNKRFEKVIYPGAGHAFHNDTGRNYNAQAAQDAWQRTLDWFATYLKGG
jgi:carboxymethylenebutenolidase